MKVLWSTGDFIARAGTDQIIHFTAKWDDFVHHQAELEELLSARVLRRAARAESGTVARFDTPAAFLARVVQHLYLDGAFDYVVEFDARLSLLFEHFKLLNGSTPDLFADGSWKIVPTMSPYARWAWPLLHGSALDDPGWRGKAMRIEGALDLADGGLLVYPQRRARQADFDWAVDTFLASTRTPMTVLALFPASRHTDQTVYSLLGERLGLRPYEHHLRRLAGTGRSVLYRYFHGFDARYYVDSGLATPEDFGLLAVLASTLDAPLSGSSLLQPYSATSSTALVPALDDRAGAYEEGFSGTIPTLPEPPEPDWSEWARRLEAGEDVGFDLPATPPRNA